MHSQTPRADRSLPGGRRGTALQERLAGLPESRFGILGIDLRLRTDSDQVRAFFDHAYRWFPPDESGDRLDLSALFSRSPAGGPVACAGSRLVDLSASPSPENQAFLFLLGAVMDRIEGSLLLHGAAVSCGESGVVLAGPAFAGKSTLVLELLKRGHVFLSDDAAPIDRASGMLHPYPRAVGIRKGPGGEPPAGVALPGKGVHSLPYRWLVDPAALGAILPCGPCRPDFLFYLDPGGASAAAEEAEIAYEIALAARPGALREELEGIGATSVEEKEATPFPTLAASFPRTPGLIAELVRLQRRHRDSILFMEEVRPPAPRVPGPPIIDEVPLSSLLLPLVRDLLNRGDESRLMQAHEGRASSLVFELAALLARVRAYRVSAGSPPDLAREISAIVSGNQGV